jgi:hypothetical protein
MKRDGPEAPYAIHGLLGPLFCPIDKANALSESLENHLIAHNLCHSDRRQHIESTVQAILATVDEWTIRKHTEEKKTY